MKKQKNQVSEKDLQPISENSIPIDLFISIFSRLPVKSIARCRCVSKKWAYILRRRDFTDLFLKLSSNRPRLLFHLTLNGKRLFFSAPQDTNLCLLAADHHMSYSTEKVSYGISPPVCGLLCSFDRNPLICNPSTGQYIALPKMTSSGLHVDIYFGYDPIDKLFKVLRTSRDYYRVLTLGTGELSWRIIECSIPHLSVPNGICINGVVYYLADDARFPKHCKLVCFYVRFEKFKFLDVDFRIWGSTLINFNGKLGVVLNGRVIHFNDRSTKLELSVLDDVENQKWSKHIYKLPSLWKNLVGINNMLYVVGMTGTCDIVFSPECVDDHFYIIYYNVVKSTVVRVEIQLGVVVPDDGLKIDTFIDHVEDVKLM